MRKMKNLGAVLLATACLLSTVACNPAQEDSSSGGVGPSSGTVVNIDKDIYDALSAEYQFDTEYVKNNKNKFSGTLYMARAYGDELPGWEYVYEAYEKMYPNVTIQNAEYSSGNASEFLAYETEGCVRHILHRCQQKRLFSQVYVSYLHTGCKNTKKLQGNLLIGMNFQLSKGKN